MEKNCKTCKHRIGTKCKKLKKYTNDYDCCSGYKSKENNSSERQVDAMVMRDEVSNSGERRCQFCGEKFDFDESIHIIKDGFHPSGSNDYYEYTHFCKNGIVLFAKGKTKKDVINKLLSEPEP